MPTAAYVDPSAANAATASSAAAAAAAAAAYGASFQPQAQQPMVIGQQIQQYQQIQQIQISAPPQLNANHGLAAQPHPSSQHQTSATDPSLALQQHQPNPGMERGQGRGTRRESE